MSTDKTYIADVTSQATTIDDFEADDFKSLVSQTDGQTGPRKAQINFAVGFASAPVENDRLIVTRIGNALYALGGDTQKIIESLGLKNGERCLYSTDTDGNILQTLYFDKNGVMVLDGGSDYAVRFSELQTAFDQLKTDFEAHLHPGSTSIAGGGAVTIGPVAPSTADIAPAKVTQFKLP